MLLTDQQKYYRDQLAAHSKPVRTDKIISELGVTDTAGFLSDLSALEKSGDVLISKNGTVQSVKGTGLVKARILSYSRSFAFAKPDGGGDDIYISNSDSKGALPGDRVILSMHTDANGPCGVVRSVYEYGSRTATGTVVRSRGKLALSADTGYRTNIEIVKNPVDAQEGDKIYAKIEYSYNGKKLICSALKIYGDAECARICADAIIDAADIPHVFGKEVLDEARRINGAGVTEEDLKGRLDLRSENIFTIDGADAKDLDDAILVRRVEKGFELSVHIADVSHYVRDGSPLDEEALRRGTSVYFADRVIPMYPEDISNGICSLNAGTDKLTLSAFMTFDDKGRMLDYRFEKAVIDSKVRGVYSEVNSLLDGTASDETKAKYSVVQEALNDAYELYRILDAAATRRGCVHFVSAESKFVLDENGFCIGLSERETGTAEKMIEQFMIAANQAAAMLAQREKFPFVYRVHESPDPASLQSASMVLRIIGVDTKKIGGNPRPSDIENVLSKVKDTPIEEIVSTVLLRSMAKARYDTQPLGHYGLALRDYCHFTSPIRRYPDSFIHRMISGYLSGSTQYEMTKRYTGKSEDAAELSSEYEIRAVNAERKSESCYMAEYMSRFIGDVFDGTICSVIVGGFFVRLPNSAEGFVNLEDLPYDEYEYDGIATIHGRRSGKTFRVGNSVKIRVAAASISSGKVDFTLEDTPD